MFHMPVRKFVLIQTALRLFSYTNFLVDAQGLATPTWQNLPTQTGILPSAFLRWFEPFPPGSLSRATQIKKPPDGGEHFARHVSHACAQICTYSNCASLVFIYKFSGGRAGTRTLDPLIKSQLLYQLSYASRTINCGNYISFYRFCKYLFTTANMTQGYMPWSPCEFQSAVAGGQPCPLRQQCRFFAQPTRARHGVPTLNPYAHKPSSTRQNAG